MHQATMMNILYSLAVRDLLNVAIYSKRLECNCMGSCCTLCFSGRVFEFQTLGEPLCFAYIYAMIQTLQVALCKASSFWVAVLTIFAFAIPTAQILKGLENSYSAQIDNVFTEIYMAKELTMYMASRHKQKKIKLELSTRDNVASLLVVMWVALDVVFSVYDFNSSYKTTTSKLLYVARFTPTLILALMNM